MVFGLAGRILFGIDYSVLNARKATWLLFLKPILIKLY